MCGCTLISCETIPVHGHPVRRMLGFLEIEVPHQTVQRDRPVLRPRIRRNL